MILLAFATVWKFKNKGEKKINALFMCTYSYVNANFCQYIELRKEVVYLWLNYDLIMAIYMPFQHSTVTRIFTICLIRKDSFYVKR